MLYIINLVFQDVFTSQSCFYLYLVFILSHSLESNPHLILQNTVFIPAVNMKPFPPVISRSIWASVSYATGSVMSFYKGYHLLYTLLLLMWSLQQEVQTVVTQTDWSSSITASSRHTEEFWFIITDQCWDSWAVCFHNMTSFRLVRWNHNTHLSVYYTLSILYL